MGKNIVFCADGTWNGPGHDENGDGMPDETNVLKLFSALAGRATDDSLRKANEQEEIAPGSDGNVAQVAKYLHGVGDSRNPMEKLIGGVFGSGFIERIVRGYTFVSRHYQPGDRIRLVGFSRGAYTARALGGMVAKMGLLSGAAMQGEGGTYDAERAYRSGTYVWSRYRQEAGKRSTLLGYLQEFSALEVDLERQVKDVPIKAIAVWDTVGALGIPVYNGTDRQRTDVFAFADTQLSPQVETGLHAIAIDEQRRDFAPTLWTGRDGIEQVWFAGAHGDVGGGYAEDALSAHSLDWMIKRLRNAGVLFSPDFRLVLPNRHEPSSAPWKRPPFNLLLTAAREHPATAMFHRSVQRRLDEYAAYEPVSLVPFLSGRRLGVERVVE